MDLWKKRIPQQNNQDQPENEASERIRVLQRKLKLQAMTAMASVALVLVLVFAMTAAWYTNVAKTSDLTFKTESWGFDADLITVADKDHPILALPGSSGFVPLTVDNSESTQGVEIGVSIDGVHTSDKTIEHELQKRIYFYVDAPKTYTFTEAVEATGTTPAVPAVEETISRVWLGATDVDNYIYNVLPGQKLTLTEEYYNDAPIRWMWVYDMLGYYFRGTVTTTEASADEFLRPIEYDYQTAVYGPDDKEKELYDPKMVGQMLKADGLSREDFLEKISGEDGYEGEIEESHAVRIGGSETSPARIFYPVDVDGSGYGVWAYLCHEEEIEQGISFDNSLPNTIDMTATMTITAVNVATAETEVTDLTALNEALAEPDVDVVSLTQDVYVDMPLTLTGGSEKVLNLNNCMLVYTGNEETNSLFSVTDGAGLTVMGGTVQNMNAGNASKTIAFASIGSDVTLSDVTVTGFGKAIDVADNTGEDGSGDSTIRIQGCTFDTIESALMIRGNGSASEASTKIVIEDSTIISDYIGICGQGAPDNWGTEIVLLNSYIEGQYAALYQPQQRSYTTINKCEMTGITGIAVKGGSVTIHDSKISGTGAYADAANANSGFTDTGDGVYVEAVYDWSTSVILKGKNEITSANAYAIDLYGADGKGPGRILIYDGTFKGGAGSAKWNGIGTFEIYGGTYEGAFSEPEDYPIVRYDTEN